MINLKKLFLILGFLFVVPTVMGVSAASMKFDQTTATVANGGTFQIAVIVDPGSDSVNATDIYVTYDSSLLKATAVTAGSLFPTVTNDISAGGKVYIAGLVNDPASSISTSGTVATITFQGLANGTATLAFNCGTSTVVKNDANATNVLVCSSNGTSTVTIGSGGSTGTNTTPTELPTTGFADTLPKFVVPGIILLLIGGALRLVL